MERARVDGAELEFAVTGAGEPVLLIHGAFIAEASAPLCAEPALNSRYPEVFDCRIQLVSGFHLGKSGPPTSTC